MGVYRPGKDGEAVDDFENLAMSVFVFLVLYVIATAIFNRVLPQSKLLQQVTAA